MITEALNTTEAVALPWPWGVALGIISVVMAGGGIWTFLAARRTARSAEKVAATADWTALNTFWQAEMAKMDLRIAALERKSQADENYIERLEHHIWSNNPPPPPMRGTPPPIINSQE